MCARIYDLGMGDEMRADMTEQLREHGYTDEDRTRCEIWDRVMGYHRPVTSWNAGKQAERAERTPFREPSLGD